MFTDDDYDFCFRPWSKNGIHLTFNGDFTKNSAHEMTMGIQLSSGDDQMPTIMDYQVVTHTHMNILHTIHNIWYNIIINIYIYVYTWYTCTYAHTCTYIHIYSHIFTYIYISLPLVGTPHMFFVRPDSGGSWRKCPTPPWNGCWQVG